MSVVFALFLLLLPLLANPSHAAEKKKADEGTVALNRGISDLNLGNDRAAIQAFSKAIRLNPKLAEAYGRRGDVYDKLGEHERAIIDIKVAARLGYRPARKVLKDMGIAW